MKKTLKKVSFVAVFVMCIALALPVFTPLTKIYAEPTSSFVTAVEEIKIENFQDTAKKGEVYQIATGTVAGGNATVTVKNPYGVDVSVVDNAFVPDIAGNYTITYTYNGVSTDLKVKVEGVTQGTQIAFDENSKYIIPSVINPNNNNEGLKLTLPNPYVVDKDGKKIPDATITTTVSFSGDSSNFVFTEDAVTLEDSTKLDTLQLDKDAEGTYTITYKYLDGVKLVAFKKETIKADLSYNNDFEFTFDYDGTKPTTAEIGKETKLPKITVQNKETKDQIEYYYTVKAVLKIGEQTYTYTENDADNDVITFKDGQFYFTPIKDGDYVVTYIVKNLFGKEATVSSSSFEITDVQDSTAPVPVVTLPYTDADVVNGILDYVDASEAVASNSDVENVIMMPIWATDNANGIVDNNLKLYRTLTNSRNTVIFDESKDITENVAGKLLVFNSTLDMTGTDDSEVFVVYVNGKAYSIKKSQVYIVSEKTDEDALKAGTYTISYVADDKAGNGVKTAPYTIKLETGYEDTETPKVEFVENLPNAIFLDEEVNFATPTTTDTKDAHLSVYIAYTTTVAGMESEEVRADDADSIIKYDTDTKTYTLTVSDNTVEKVKVIAYSRDDSGNIGKAEQTIVVLKTGDTTPTTVVSKDTNIAQSDAGFVQGAEITLPTVVYSDDLVDYVNVEIIITNPSTPNPFNAYDAEIIRDAGSNQITVKDAKFVASLSGEYQITYVTTDASNNKTIVVFTLDVEANLQDLVLEFKGLPSEINNGKAERGETIKLDIPTLDLSNTSLKLKNDSYRVVVKGPTDYKLESNYSFTPNEIGTYRIQYVAEVLEDDDTPYETVTSKEFKIEVTDTTGPTFVDFSDILSYFAEKNANGSVAKGTTMAIRLPQCNDEDIDLATSYVTISAPNSSRTTCYLNNPEELNGYTFSKDATYTITYTLVDIYGNETKQSATLDVGDVEPPKITVKDDLFKSEYKINDVINVDLSKISAIDKVDGEILIYNETTKKYSTQEKAEIKITVKNTTTGSEVANDVTSTNTDLNFQYTITTAGEYSVTIEISDTTGKVATYDNISFSVSENPNNGMSAEEILGTILIVISVLLLVGVITYFIVSKKKLEKRMK